MAYRTLQIALEASTAGYVGGLSAATAATDRFGVSAAAARREAEIPPSAVGWESFATKLEATGKKLTKSLTVPILAFGAAAVAAAVDVDHAYHTIEQRTGATGARLQGLKKDFDAVAKTTGASFGHVAEVMSQLNVGLGLTGPSLQGITREFLTLERVAGAGAPTIDQVTKVMNAWQVAGAAVGLELDHLFVASQRTGVPMATLVDDLTRFGPQMRFAGVSIDQTTALFAKLEQAGVPVSKVVRGISSYLGGVAKSGGDVSGALGSVVDRIAGLYRLNDAVAANKLAIDSFGKLAGPIMAQQIRDGRLATASYAELAAEIQKSAGAILHVGNATLPLSVRLNQLKNEIILALAPIGDVILPNLMAGLHGVVPVIASIAGAFAHLPAGVQEWGVGLLAAAAAVGPVMSVLGGLGKQLLAISDLAVRSSREVKWLVQDVGFLGAGLTALTVAGTAFALVQMFEAFAHQGDSVRNMSKALTGDMQRLGVAVDVAFAKRIDNTALGKSLTEGGFGSADGGIMGMFKKGLDSESVRSLFKQTGVSIADVTSHLKQGKSAYNDWVATVTRSAYRRDGGLGDVLERELTRLGKAYHNADDGGREHIRQLDTVRAALIATGSSAQEANTQANLLMGLKGDDAFIKQLAKAKIDLQDLPKDARYLGLSLKAAADQVQLDPVAFKAELDGLTKYVDGVAKTWGGFTDVLSLKSDPKAVATALKGVASAQDALAKAHDAAAAAAVKGNISQLQSANAVASAEAAVAKAQSAKVPSQAAIDAAQRHLDIVNAQASAQGQNASAIDAVTKAEQGLKDAQANLADVQNQSGPFDANRIKKFYDDRLSQAMTFTQDVNKAFKMGYDPQLIARVIQAGPEKASQQVHALVAGNSADMLKLVNDGESALNAITSVARDQARLQAIAMDPVLGGQQKIRDLGGAMAISQATGAGLHPMTVAELQAATGLTPVAAKRILDEFQLPFAQNPTIPKVDINPALAAIWNLKTGTKDVMGLAAADMVMAMRVIEQAGKDGAHATAEGIALELGIGVDKVNWFMTAFAGDIQNAVNPILAAVGKPLLHAIDVALPHFNTGGHVDGPNVNQDVVPAMLTPGEVVIRKGSVDKFGVGALLAINDGQVPDGWHVPQKFAAGGAVGAALDPASVAAAKSYAAGQVGKPYVWGGVGPNSFDCSGLWSAIVNVVRGAMPNSRLFTTNTIGGGAAGLGLLPGLGQVSIGNSVSGGHMAGTIDGSNFEATPPSVYGPGRARGANDAYFQQQFHLGSGFFAPGGPAAVAAAMPAVPKFPAGTLGDTGAAAAQYMRDAAQWFAAANTLTPTSVTGGDPGAGGGSAGIATITGGLIGRILATIRQMESGGDYGARNPVSSASGAYQFIDSTWGGYGGFPRAFMAPPAVQDARAAQDVQADLSRYGGAIEAVPASWYTGGYRGHGQLNYNPGGPGNPLTVQQYVDRWQRVFDSFGPQVNGFNSGGVVAHRNSFDSGGSLQPGWNMVRNDTGKVEHVRPMANGGLVAEMKLARYLLDYDNWYRHLPQFNKDIVDAKRTAQNSHVKAVSSWAVPNALRWDANYHQPPAPPAGTIGLSAGATSHRMFADSFAGSAMMSGTGGGSTRVTTTYAPNVTVAINAPVFGVDDLNSKIQDQVIPAINNNYGDFVEMSRRQEMAQT
ncbi:MAG: phage tail tape measure protein [Acidimicrobiales bacterium]|nr:phage tail tape measure protein [Acidimicrobiales bacterium]